MEDTILKQTSIILHENKTDLTRTSTKEFENYLLLKY